MRRALAAAAALCPSLAHANAGIGFFLLDLPFVLAALLPAILVEALVYVPALHVPLGRALSHSWRANLASTLLGVVLGIAADFGLVAMTGSAGPEPTRGPALAMLVPFFLLSWWVEHRMIARRAAELPRSRVAAATAAANALTYAGMAVAVWLVLPAEGSLRPQMIISEAMLAASGARSAVTERWLKDKSFPKDMREMGVAQQPGGRYRVSLGEGGRIEVEILVDNPRVGGKHLVLTQRPAPQSPGLEWKCSSPDIEQRLLPAPCREPVP